MNAPLMMVVASFVVMAGKTVNGFFSKCFGMRNVFYSSMLFGVLCP